MTLREQIYKRVKWFVISGELEADQPISERTLSAQLGTSRTPLREALAQLENEGFVHNEPGKGYLVSALTLRQALELFDLRLCIESYAVGQICERNLSPDIAKLAELNEEYRLAVSCCDAETRLIKNVDFHETLIAGVDNSAILRVGQQMRDRHLWLGFTMQRHQLLYIDAGVQEHEKIVLALAARDGAAAQKLIREHIDHARKRLYMDISG